MLFISHDLPVIRQMCDRIGVMKAGQMVELASGDALFSDSGTCLYPRTDRKYSSVLTRQYASGSGLERFLLRCKGQFKPTAITWRTLHLIKVIPICVGSANAGQIAARLKYASR